MKTALKSFLRGQIVNLFLMSVDKNKTDILRTRLKGGWDRNTKLWNNRYTTLLP